MTMTRLSLALLLAALLSGASGAVGPVAAVGVAEVAEAAEEEPSGTAIGRDGTLGSGCHAQSTRYRVEHGGDDWMLELFVRDRTGAEVSAATVYSTSEPARGTATWRLCRAATRAGKFTVRGMLTVNDGWQQTEHPVKRDAFRLTRP